QYDNSQHMLEDIKQRKLKVLNTNTTPSIRKSHPMHSKTSLTDSLGTPMLANDIFRAVHDTLSHGFGYNFSFTGEKGAWLMHRSALPKEAHLAIWNETRGQNAWYNAGPHMRKTDGKGFYTLIQPN